MNISLDFSLLKTSLHIYVPRRLPCHVLYLYLYIGIKINIFLSKNLIRYCTPSLAEWLVLRYLELQVGVCRGTWYCRSGFAGTRRGGHVTSPPTPRHASDCPNPVCNILLEHTPIKIQPRFNFVSLNACWSTTCMHN